MLFNIIFLAIGIPTSVMIYLHLRRFPKKEHKKQGNRQERILHRSNAAVEIFRLTVSLREIKKHKITNSPEIASAKIIATRHKHLRQRAAKSS